MWTAPSQIPTAVRRFLTASQVRPLTADSWLSIFKPDAAKQAQREKEDEEKEAAKVGPGTGLDLALLPH